jgi:hypothetical protein
MRETENGFVDFPGRRENQLAMEATRGLWPPDWEMINSSAGRISSPKLTIPLAAMAATLHYSQGAGNGG